MKTTTVLLVDDHTVVRQGLRLLLQAHEDMRVVGEAETGLRAVELAKKMVPDVIIMDVVMPKLNGLDATRQITRCLPATRVLMLSCYNDVEYVRRSAEVGAAGYLLKESAAADLVKAIRDVRQGHSAFSPGVARWLLMGRRSKPVRPDPANGQNQILSSRQLNVLRLIAEGTRNKRIALELGISVKTVEKHRQEVMNKLNIHDAAGLTRYAIANGIIKTSAEIQRL